MSEKNIKGTAKSWGLRLAVPSAVLKGIGVQVGDNIVWSFGERDGKPIAILQKAEKGVKKDAENV